MNAIWSELILYGIILAFERGKRRIVEHRMERIQALARIAQELERMVSLSTILRKRVAPVVFFDGRERDGFGPAVLVFLGGNKMEYREVPTCLLSRPERAAEHLCASLGC